MASRPRQNHLRRFPIPIVWVFALLLGGGVPSLVQAAERSVDAVSVALRVHRGGERRPDGTRIHARSSWVSGVARYQLDRPAGASDVLVLLDFAAFMREEPADLDEVKRATYLDGPFDAGALTVRTVRGASSWRRVGSRRDITVALDPGTTEVQIEYAVEVPHRYWPFGCIRRRCSLSGAIAPLPSETARGGRFLPEGRVVVPVRWTVREATLASPGAMRPRSAGRNGRGDRSKLIPDEIVVVGAEDRSAYPSVFWGPRWRRATRVHRGVELRVLHMHVRPTARVPEETAIQLYRDVPGHALRTLTESVDLLIAAGFGPSPGTIVTVVQGPLRSELAQAHPATVLVSDQAFELFPSRRLLKFHEDALARASLDTLVGQGLQGRHDASTDLWLTSAITFALLPAWREAREHRDEFAADILRNFTFVPAVDRFLYTQQASFSQTYFRGVEDQQTLRNHPLWFANELPTGRRIYEKLADTLGPKAMGSFMSVLLHDPDNDPRALAAQAYGRRLDWFFDQWLGPYPAVDYIIADVVSRPGTGGWHHTIVVERDGERGVIEPVQVLVTERSGERHYLVWNGELGSNNGKIDDEPARGSHTFTLSTSTKIKTVRLDPRARLLQTDRSRLENADPRFNDRHPPAFRFLYTGAGLSLAASEFINAATAAARFNAITGFAAFEGSLRRDLRRTGHVVVARDRETNISVGVGANFWFGRKVNAQRRRSRARLFVTTSWLNSRSLDPRGGVRISQRLALIDDTRRFTWWPEHGRRLIAGVTARQTIRVDDGPADHRFDVVADASWTHLWRIVHDHVIVTSLAAQAVIPIASDPEFRALSRAGGIGGLSGYAADEIFGLGLAIAQAEYRHVFLNNMRLNLLHIGYVRSLGGVAFAGAATTSGCDSFGGWFGADSWYGHVGYGLTARFSVLGVTPQLVRVDASVPLVRRRGVKCLDQRLPDYLADVQGLDDAAQLLPPFNLNVTFVHPF